jgi:hypothetical protein
MHNRLDDKVPDFLLNPACRLYRHLILQGFVFLISLNVFLELEKTRRDRFDCALTATGDTASVHVPPLLFIPFVENRRKVYW